jgi:hypothetical protein
MGLLEVTVSRGLWANSLLRFPRVITVKGKVLYKAQVLHCGLFQGNRNSRIGSRHYQLQLVYFVWHFNNNYFLWMKYMYEVTYKKIKHHIYRGVLAWHTYATTLGKLGSFLKIDRHGEDPCGAT